MKKLIYLLRNVKGKTNEIKINGKSIHRSRFSDVIALVDSVANMNTMQLSLKINLQKFKINKFTKTKILMVESYEMRSNIDIKIGYTKLIKQFCCLENSITEYK